MRWQRRQLKAPARRSAVSSRQGEGRSWPRIALLGAGLGAVVAIAGYLTWRPARELASEVVDRAGARRAHGNGTVELEATPAGGTLSPAEPEPEGSSPRQLVKSSS
jgi:hypothetical protein